MQPFGHNRHRPKFRGLLCPLLGELGSHLTQCGLDGHVHTKWHVDPFSRLTTIDMGQKVGGCCSVVTRLNLDSDKLDSHN